MFIFAIQAYGHVYIDHLAVLISSILYYFYDFVLQFIIFKLAKEVKIIDKRFLAECNPGSIRLFLKGTVTPLSREGKCLIITLMS